jgi:hypothetical protein
MMRARHHGHHRNPILPTVESSGKECWAWCLCLRRALIIFFFIVLSLDKAAHAKAGFTLNAAPGGITGTFQNTNPPNYRNTFGTMNALGLGTPQPGLTVAVLSNGALYFSQYQVQFSGLGGGGQTARLVAYVSTNFTHPAAQIIQNCPSSATCTSSGSYSAMSTVQGAPTTVVASMGNATATAGLGIFLPDNDGAGFFAGVDNIAQITFTMIDNSNNNQIASATFSFNGTPSQTVQTAVSLTLATATGGLTITPTADYSINFGNVNGLGIGPGAGLTVSSASSGVVYATPYLLKPIFTDFASTKASIKVLVTTNFAHPSILQLEDGAANTGPFTAIGTTTTAATTITTTAADRSTITRFLGLFVANTSGAGAFTGSDNATLTFTMTVP